jgi:hypothetical protein
MDDINLVGFTRPAFGYDNALPQTSPGRQGVESEFSGDESA